MSASTDQAHAQIQIGTHGVPVEPTTYRIDFQDPPGTVRSQIPGVVWRTRIDSDLDADVRHPSLALTTSRLFHFQDGRLVARDLGSGRKLWEAGKSLRPTVLTGGGRVYVVSNQGSVLAFDQATGRLRWTVRGGPKEADRLDYVEAGNVLLVNSYKDGLAAVAADSGRLLWREFVPQEPFKHAQSYGPQDVSGGIVIVATIEGEPQANRVYGLRLADGQIVIDGVPGWSPIRIEGNRVLLRDTWPDMDHPELFLIREIDLLSGKLLRSFQYKLKPANPSIFVRYLPMALIDQDLFVDMDCTVYRFRLGNPNPVAFQVRGNKCPAEIVPPGSRATRKAWVGGPYRNRLFFWDGASLYSQDTATNRVVNFPDVRAKIAALEIIGERLYVGQLDGWFLAFDLSSGRTVLRAYTGARNYGTIALSGNKLIVQAENNLLVFNTP